MKLQNLDRVSLRKLFLEAIDGAVSVDLRLQAGIQWLCGVRSTQELAARTTEESGRCQLALLLLCALTAGVKETAFSTRRALYLKKWADTREGREAVAKVLHTIRVGTVVSAPPVWKQRFSVAWFLLYRCKHILAPLANNSYAAIQHLTDVMQDFNPCSKDRIDFCWPASAEPIMHYRDQHVKSVELMISNRGSTSQLYRLHHPGGKEMYALLVVSNGKKGAMCFNATNFLVDQCCGDANYLRRSFFVSSITANAPNIFVVLGARRLGRLVDYFHCATQDKYAEAKQLAHAAALAYTAMLNNSLSSTKGTTREIVKALAKETLSAPDADSAIRQWIQKDAVWYNATESVDGTLRKHARCDSDHLNWEQRHMSATKVATAIQKTSALVCHRILFQE